MVVSIQKAQFYLDSLFLLPINPNGYIDIVRTSMIDRGLIHGNNVNAFITEVTHDIDEQNDFDFLDIKPKNIKDLLQKNMIKPPKWRELPSLCDKYKIRKNLIKPLYIS